ncbi:Secretion Associated Ras Related [Carpediemonas membranifera]|uniref:Secretion Associated Ras Related n=1 Tax=Carpediemonas membranifera TaxID=201153 RepID=A0A8J6AYZ0_9EUKA|nr:Secretion Associated Ras Related [Carpediemonas membranifera]|eukprot:KAG9395795.1 Secretion Associated Ras Related [Carpediemonas membranifera]
MTFTDWLMNALAFLGLYNKKCKLVFLGLDNAGKTTLLHMLKDGRLVQHKPTYHPTSEEIRMGKITFSAFDLGGHKEARRIWQDYYAQCDGIVYIVDVADVERMHEACETLQELLSNDILARVPVAVLGNKVDRPEACSESQFLHSLDIRPTGRQVPRSAIEGDRPIEVFMSSILRKCGYAEAFRWMAQYV